MDHKTNNTIQAFWIGMGSVSSLLLTVVSAAILSRYFDKAEYGTYKQILYVYNTLLLVFTAGLPKVFSYFLPRYTVAQGKDIVWLISKALFFAGVIFSVILFAFSGLIAQLLKNPELETGLKYFSPMPMLLLPTLGIEGIFSTYKKTIFIAIYNTISRLLMLLFIVLPVMLFKGSYLNAIYGWIAVSVLTLLSAYFFKNIPFKGIKSEKSFLTLKEVFAYSLPIVGASIAGIAIRSSDQFFISRFFGVETFAEYSNGFNNIPFVAMVTSATSVVMMPVLSKMIFDKVNVKIIVNLWSSVLTKSAYIIYPIVVFFLFHSNTIVTILYSDLYKGSTIYFQISMILNFFNIVIFAPLIFSLGLTKYYANLHVAFAVIAWVGEYLVVLIFKSPVALAIFSILMSISLVIIAMNKVAREFKVKIYDLVPYKQILTIILHSLIICGIEFLLTTHLLVIPENRILLLTLSTVLYGALLLLTARFFNLKYIIVVDPLIHRLRKKYVRKI